MQRRQFLQLAFLTSASLSVGWPAHSISKHKRGVLIWLELRGGNDGLNTVIPYENELYQQARPTLRIKDGIPIGNELALHPALSPLIPAWKSQEMSIALGVGWQHPNRSHFKATDQWATANASGEGAGWLAQAIESQGLNYPLIGLGPTGSKSIEGGKTMALQINKRAMSREDPTLKNAKNLISQRPLLKKMLSLEKQSHIELLKIKNNLAPLPTNLNFPKSSLRDQFMLALQLIGSDNPPPFIQMEHSGYDTHANQLIRHERLLSQLAKGITTFRQSLKYFKPIPVVTILITSEFGRRLSENGSKGTDHGNASIALLIGDALNKPFIGHYPSLKELDSRGDLISSLSPPDLYQLAINSITKRL